MKYTSAEANKLLRATEEKRITVASLEEMSKEFLAAVGEDVESVRPEYVFKATQETILQLEEKIRKIKHAINVFNSTTVIPEFGITIDEMLILIPQLSVRNRTLMDMKRKLPKVREQTTAKISNVIDYRYINYDLNEVSAEQERISETLYKAQMALDNINNTLTFEIDV